MSNAAEGHPVEIVVCVHNSPNDVRLCLSSVRETLRPRDRLVIVDDGSAEETKRICEEVAEQLGKSACLLIRRSDGSGFCRAANAGLRATTAETVILLNSDTIVTGDWIDRLAACMVANWQIGIVGPLSNAGGWQSIPKLPTHDMPSNPVPDDPAIIAAIHAHCSTFGDRFAPPIVEQINGFCMAVSREVLSTVGLFDEVSFPMGYGEEVDLTIRALNSGFLCAVAVDCFVFHAKTKSYTPETRAKYNKAGQARLRELHSPERLMAVVQQTQTHTTFRAIRDEAQVRFPAKGWIL